jgi:hypothetical protein
MKLLTWLNNHTRSYRFIGSLINQDEATSDSILSIAIKKYRLCSSYHHPTNIVHVNLILLFIAVQGIDV